MIRTGCPTETFAMSTSFRFTFTMSDFRSATVKRTVPALNEETPEVTVSPSSTPFLMTTPDIGLVTRAHLRGAGGGDRDAVVLDDPVARPRRPERLGGDVPAGDVVLQRLVADEAGVPERLLGAQLPLGVLQAELGLGQPPRRPRRATGPG